MSVGVIGRVVLLAVPNDVAVRGDGRHRIRRRNDGRHLGRDEATCRLAGLRASGLRHLRDPVMNVQLRIDAARAAPVGPHRAGRQCRTAAGRPRAAAGRGARRRTPRCRRRGAADAARLDPVGLAGNSRRSTQDLHLERFCGRTDLIEADRSVPRQMDGEVIDDGRRLDARIEPGTLVIRAPRPVATAA